MENMENQEKKVDDRIQAYFKGGAYTDRKVTDMPNDANSVVPRKYVNLNGNTASRPASSVIGQFYFDTDVGYPVWNNGNGWVDAQGNSA